MVRQLDDAKIRTRVPERLKGPHCRWRTGAVVFARSDTLKGDLVTHSTSNFT